MTRGKLKNPQAKPAKRGSHLSALRKRAERERRLLKERARKESLK